MRIKLSKSFGFEAAHFLPSFPEGHKCRRLHGHSFQFELVVEGEVEESKGYLVDYGEIKAVGQKIEAELDHYCLNDVRGLENPTAEVISRWIWGRAKAMLPALTAVVVKETCTTACEYRGN